MEEGDRLLNSAAGEFLLSVTAEREINTYMVPLHWMECVANQIKQYENISSASGTCHTGAQAERLKIL